MRRNALFASVRRFSSLDLSGLSFSSPSQFAAARVALFDRLYQRGIAAQGSLKKTPIKIRLPDGKVVAGTANETTPLAVAESISHSLSKRVLAAKVPLCTYHKGR